MRCPPIPGKTGYVTSLLAAEQEDGEGRIIMMIGPSLKGAHFFTPHGQSFTFKLKDVNWAEMGFTTVELKASSLNLNFEVGKFVVG